MINNTYLDEPMTLENLRAIQAIKKSSPNEVVNLSGNDFMRIELPNLDLSGYSLREIDLSGCQTLNKALLVINNADLSKALLVESVFKGLSLNSSVINSIDCTSAVLDGGCFDGTRGGGAIFQNTSLVKASFIDIILNNANFSGALLDRKSVV